MANSYLRMKTLILFLKKKRRKKKYKKGKINLNTTEERSICLPAFPKTIPKAINLNVGGKILPTKHNPKPPSPPYTCRPSSSLGPAWHTPHILNYALPLLTKLPKMPLQSVFPNSPGQTQLTISNIIIYPFEII